MGCCGSKEKEETSDMPEKKQYSWDTRKEQIDPKEFIIDGADNEVLIRKPGSINGEQFVIQNCKNTKIFLLDHIATITIDDCTECQFVIGPVRTSIFIRDCQDCKCIVSCQQFRTRDCSKMDIFLSCTTQPIIEASARLRFGCYQLTYDGLLEHFNQSTLSLFNNNWNSIHDFTPVPESKNWLLFPENIPLSEMFSVKTSSTLHGNSMEQGSGDTENINYLDQLHFSFDSKDSVIPLTRGSREKVYNDSCFVVIFHCDDAKEVAVELIKALHDKADLIQTKEVKLSSDEALRIFTNSSSSLWKSAQQGPVIGLEFNGDDCTTVCDEVVKKCSRNDQSIYVSASTESAIREIESFYNYCDMQMAV